jgi:hypothetical protein
MGKRFPETCWADSKINVIVIAASIWTFILFTYIGTKYCRPPYSLAACRQLSVTDSIPQNCLQISMNILDFSEYAAVHLGKTIPEMYV